MRSLQRLSPHGSGHGAVLELDDAGGLVGSLHTDRMSCISELSEHHGALYAGSPLEDFLGRVPAPPPPRTLRVRTKHTDGSLSVSVGKS